jgi:hypothetical protein
LQTHQRAIFWENEQNGVMGAFVCRNTSGLDVAENTLKILVLGFCDSGKTFIVYSWSLGVDNVMKTLPTDPVMFNVERLNGPTSGIPMCMWDIGGKMLHRRRSYFLGTQGNKTCVVYFGAVAHFN